MTMTTLLIGACSTNAPSASQPDTVSLPSVEAVPIAATPTPQLTVDSSANSSSTVANQPDSQPETVIAETVIAETVIAETVIAESSNPCTVQPHLDFVGYPAYESLQEIMGCAVAEPSFEPVAINEFGEGPEFDRFMLWTSSDQMIYVLRPDGSWEMHLDEWSEALPELMCSPAGYAFASPPLPRRGFGKLWCEIGGLAEVMGTIVKEERLCQHAVLQQFEGGQLLACFEDATYQYFRIMNDRSWENIFIQ